jgi:hypothetical protein
LSDPEPPVQKHQLSYESRPQTLVKINHRGSMSKINRETDRTDYDPSATGCETSSIKEPLKPQSDNRTLSNSAYNFKSSSFKESNSSKMKTTVQNFNNQPGNGGIKRNILKKASGKSGIAKQNKLRTVKYNPASSRFQANPSSFYDRYLEYNKNKKKNKNTINQQISPPMNYKNTIMSNDQTNVQQEATASKEQLVQVTGFLPSRYTNQGPLLRHPNIHYRIETATGVFYEPSLQPQVLKSYGKLKISNLYRTTFDYKKIDITRTYKGSEIAWLFRICAAEGKRTSDT